MIGKPPPLCWRGAQEDDGGKQCAGSWLRRSPSPPSSRRLGAKLPRDAQDQCRRRGRAAERGAHCALCGQGARAVRQALRRGEHHPVRRRRGRHVGHGGGAGERDLEPAGRRHRTRAQGQADLGPRAAPAASLRRARRGEDRRGPQGQAPLCGRRGRRLQLADGTRDPAHREPDAGRRAVHLAGHRRTAARIPRRPDRGRRAASGGRVPGAAEEARRTHFDHARPTCCRTTRSITTAHRTR